MAKGWKCGRCSTDNDEAAINCATCGFIRGGVVPVPNTLTTSSSAAPVVHADVAAATQPILDASASASTARPLWRRLPLRLLVTIAVIVVVSLAGWYFNASRSSSGEITKAGDLTSSDLRVGDCYDLKDPSADLVEKVAARPCTSAHEYETFFVGSMPDGEYPGEAGFTAFVKDRCGPAFDTYVGKAYADSELEIFWFYPSADGWSAGDQSIQCAVYHPRIHSLTASLRGSNR